MIYDLFNPFRVGGTTWFTCPPIASAVIIIQPLWGGKQEIMNDEF